MLLGAAEVSGESVRFQQCGLLVLLAADMTIRRCSRGLRVWKLNPGMPALGKLLVGILTPAGKIWDNMCRTDTFQAKYKLSIFH